MLRGKSKDLSDRTRENQGCCLHDGRVYFAFYTRVTVLCANILEYAVDPRSCLFQVEGVYDVVVVVVGEKKGFGFLLFSEME